MDVPTSGPLESKLTLTIVKRSTGEIFSPQYKVGLVSNQDVLEFRGGNWTSVHRKFPIKLPTAIPDDAEPTQPEPTQPQPAPHEQHHYSPADSSGPINCPSCGHGNSAEYSFCESCGTPIPRGQICPSCGQASSLSARFCDQCGANLPGALGSRPHSQVGGSQKSYQKPQSQSSAPGSGQFQRPVDPPIFVSESEPKRKRGCLRIIGMLTGLAMALFGCYAAGEVTFGYNYEESAIFNALLILIVGIVLFFFSRGRKR